MKGLTFFGDIKTCLGKFKVKLVIGRAGGSSVTVLDGNYNTIKVLGLTEESLNKLLEAGSIFHGDCNWSTLSGGCLPPLQLRLDPEGRGFHAIMEDNITSCRSWQGMVDTLEKLGYEEVLEYLFTHSN